MYFYWHKILTRREKKKILSFRKREKRREKGEERKERYKKEVKDEQL